MSYRGDARIAWYSMLAIYVATLACAPKNAGQEFVTTCQVGSDQLGTFAGRWEKVPVPVAFRTNPLTGISDFSPGEIQAMINSGASWNAFSAASLNFQALDLGGGDPTSVRFQATTKPSTVCNFAIYSQTTNAYTGAVVVYKDTTWPYPNIPQAIAITSVCPIRGGANIPNFSMAITEVNYQNFFIAGRAQPDLQSIIAHEFGHLLGLKHSCEAAGSSGVPSCSTPGVDQSYLTALMFPAFAFANDGTGEIRRDLQSNDQGRTNCLYQDLKQ